MNLTCPLNLIGESVVGDPPGWEQSAVTGTDRRSRRKALFTLGESFVGMEWYAFDAIFFIAYGDID